MSSNTNEQNARFLSSGAYARLQTMNPEASPYHLQMMRVHDAFAASDRSTLQSGMHQGPAPLALRSVAALPSSDGIQCHRPFSTTISNVSNTAVLQPDKTTKYHNRNGTNLAFEGTASTIEQAPKKPGRRKRACGTCQASRKKVSTIKTLSSRG